MTCDGWEIRWTVITCLESGSRVSNELSVESRKPVQGLRASHQRRQSRYVFPDASAHAVLGTFWIYSLSFLKKKKDKSFPRWNGSLGSILLTLETESTEI